LSHNIRDITTAIHLLEKVALRFASVGGP